MEDRVLEILGRENSAFTIPELEIELEGTIDKDTYFFNFYIDKPFDEYLKMKKSKKIKSWKLIIQEKKR